jgi:hypothetical protein
MPAAMPWAADRNDWGPVTFIRMRSMPGKMPLGRIPRIVTSNDTGVSPSTTV